MNTRSVRRSRRSSPLSVPNMSAGQTNARLMKLTRVVNAMKPELKCYQQRTDITNVTGAGAISYVSSILQGSDVVNRLGDRIRAKKVTLQYKLESGFTGIAGSTAVYGVYLIKDNQASGLVPVISGTPQAIFTNSSPLAAIIAPTVKDRFTILRSHIFGGPSVGLGNEIPLHKWVVKQDSITSYQGAGGTIASAGKNAYWIVILTDDAANTVDVSYFAELLFTDD